MRALIIAIPLVMLASVAMADMPNYDVDKHCKKISAMGGSSSQMMLNACYDQEQSAYDGLKPKWDSLSKTMRAHCDNIAKIGGVGSFMMLNACVDQEEAAAEANKSRQFKR